MANPIVIIALLAGGAYLLFKKPETAKQQPATTTALPPVQSGAQSIQVPVSLPGVAAENQPTVTLTPPASASPGIAYTPAATPAPTSTLPSIAKFPDLPGATPSTPATPVVLAPTGDKSEQYPPTAQQVLTHTLPQVAAQVLTPPTAVQVQESLPSVDTNGTINLAAKMINAESAPGWKTALMADIKVWQSKLGLTQDGKFGPKSAAKLAEEVGVLPLVRYFPATSSSKAAALKAYRDQIYTMAANADNHNPAQAAALRSSAAYDAAQGWATNPPAIPATARAAQGAALAAVLKG
jgi:hypothetical protein